MPHGMRHWQWQSKVCHYRASPECCASSPMLSLSTLLKPIAVLLPWAHWREGTAWHVDTVPALLAQLQAAALLQYGASQNPRHWSLVMRGDGAKAT